MSRKTRVLTSDEIRAIIRLHPVPFAGIATISAETAEEASNAIATFVMSNADVVNSIVAAGMEIDIAAAKRLGVFRWLAAADIIGQTSAAGLPLPIILYEELEHLCFSNGSLQ